MDDRPTAARRVAMTLAAALLVGLSAWAGLIVARWLRPATHARDGAPAVTFPSRSFEGWPKDPDVVRRRGLHLRRRLSQTYVVRGELPSQIRALPAAIP